MQKNEELKTNLQKLADEAIVKYKLTIQDKLLTFPLNSYRICQYNYGLIRSKPRTILMDGMTSQQATEIQKYTEEQIRKAFIKKLNKEVPNGKEKRVG